MEFAKPSSSVVSDDPYYPVDNSFIVQIDARVSLCRGQIKGRVEHLPSGKQALFESLEQLGEFIRNKLADDFNSTR